nr:uncharacterized protein LOC117689956 [Crassostrea gigas]
MTPDQRSVIVRKTDVHTNTSGPPDKVCPIHLSDHSLNHCREFSRWDMKTRKDLLKKKGICFKCCASNNHLMKNCKHPIQCEKCDSELHPTALHVTESNTRRTTFNSSETANNYGGEGTEVSSKCTTLCGFVNGGRSCAKIVLAKVFPTDRPQDAVTVYVLLDDQSNHTLAHSELLNQLGVTSDPIPYRLKSCAGVTEASGGRAVGFCIQSMDGLAYHKLPPIIECNDIPDNVMEIPTPEVARAHPHLRHIANELPPLRKDVSIQLLIGRDLVDIHQVQGQVTGPSASPFAQKLSLGWVIIGDVCLDGRHKPSDLSVLKTNIQHDGRGTIFTPCQNSLHVKVQGPLNNGSSQTLDFKGDSVFYTDRHDNKIGNSVEDREFLSMMDQTFHMDSRGNWTSPLPFKNTRPTLTNNMAQVFRRAINLDNSLKRNPEKLKQMCEFMENIFNTGAAERAPEIPNGHECWYIPIFAVTHPKKPGKVRAVFDSSIVHQGCSLNDALLSGPNLTNNLLGILLRFRKDSCAIAGDIQQMFYRFFVNERDRDYLRFYWYEDNDPHRKMIEYRMTVHVFGNRPSPAVATYGLRRAVRDADTEVVSFVNQDFYVDDALTSRPTPVEVIDLMRRTQKALDEEGKIRLHKIVSNVQEVLDAFPPDDLGKDIKDFSIGDDDNLVQHSLGLAWNLSSDCFIFQKPDADVPFTRRGILSKVNSIFDPVGFLSPLTICGKMILREMCTRSPSWDDPLLEEHRDRWESWSMSLDQLSTLRIPRMFVPSSLSLATDPQVLIFSDASETAIAAAAYLKVNHYIGFIMAKSKLASSAGHSIPLLELCGAVLATEIGEFVSDHLSIPTSSIRYFTDSKVVLGYIRNRTRRFYNYVSNRIVRIHAVSTPSQWNYVPTHLNPADAATRGSVSDMRNMLDTWLTGPEQFCSKDLTEIGPEVDYPLVSPDEDKDIRPEVSAFKADLSENLTPMEDRFAKFSTWDSLLSALSTLRHVSASYRGSNDCTGWHLCQNTKHESELKDMEHFILRCVQRQAFKAELEAIEGKHNLPRNSRIQDLSPYIDDVGLLRVGGRLNNLQGSGLASLNPVIVPNGHVATLLVRFFHNKVVHQGRAITEGAVRSHGFWILGGKRLISSIIYSCVVCRKLRRTPQEQKMADLPLDRLTPGPPFTSVGLDVFGPWPVVTRKTRGGSAQSKRWAVLFSCLTTRAVHIEVIEDMSSSCFVNALRRFVALRGPVKLFRSDKGTNFIVNAVNVEDKMVQTYLKDNRATWLFNAPHASHMGGVWERAIGSARKILDSMLLQEGPKDLTHEVLVTLMAEVCGILNSRPIAAIDTDPSSPMVLSPNILLTQKQGEIGTISDHLSIKDMYSASWKHVQVLSDMFWKKWRATYLESLQRRRKWCSSKQNLKTGDIVLLREKDVHRNMWPLGIVERPIETNDRLVRKAVIRVVKDGKVTTYTRPIAEMVLLLE